MVHVLISESPLTLLVVHNPHDVQAYSTLAVVVSIMFFYLLTRSILALAYYLLILNVLLSSLFLGQSLEYGMFKQVFSSVITLTELTFSINYTIFVVIHNIYHI